MLGRGDLAIIPFGGNFASVWYIIDVVLEVDWSRRICLWSNGLVVKALDSQSRSLVFKTTG